MIPIKSPVDNVDSTLSQVDSLSRRDRFQSRKASLEQAYIDLMRAKTARERISAAKDFLSNGIEWLPLEDIDAQQFKLDVINLLDEVSKPHYIRVVARRNSDGDIVNEVSVEGMPNQAISYVTESALQFYLLTMQQQVDEWIWTKLLVYVEKLAHVLMKLEILREEDEDFDTDSLDIEEFSTKVERMPLPTKSRLPPELAEKVAKLLRDDKDSEKEESNKESVEDEGTEVEGESEEGESKDDEGN